MNQQLQHEAVLVIPDDRQRETSFNNWLRTDIPKEPLIKGGFNCIDPATSRVQCTTCGLEVVATALNGNNPYDYHMQQSPSCLFFNPYRHESNRRESFLYWIGYPGHPDIDDLVAAGYYLTESGQRHIQCFCCGISLAYVNNMAD